METLLVERDPARPGLTVITLNRPQKLNAIGPLMHTELQQVCRELQDDWDTRVVILTGAGRAFSAGADLRAGPPPRAESDLERRHRVGAGNRTCAAIEALDQVTIAAINGLTIGGAVVFAISCDMRIAAESAWFSIPEVELELPLTWNAIPRLMRELGPARTKELVMTCDRFSSDEALSWGFVNRVYPDDRLMPEAFALAEKLLAKDPLTLAATKSTANAVAQLMVPEQGTSGDREQMLLAYMMQRRRRAESGDQP